MAPFSVGKGAIERWAQDALDAPDIQNARRQGAARVARAHKSLHLPLRTILQPTTMVLSVLARTAAAGFSSISMTWLAATMGKSRPSVLCFFNSALMTSGLPKRETGHIIGAGRFHRPSHDCVRGMIAAHCIQSNVHKFRTSFASLRLLIESGNRRTQSRDSSRQQSKAQISVGQAANPTTPGPANAAMAGPISVK